MSHGSRSPDYYSLPRNSLDWLSPTLTETKNQIFPISPLVLASDYSYIRLNNILPCWLKTLPKLKF